MIRKKIVALVGVMVLAMTGLMGCGATNQSADVTLNISMEGAKAEVLEDGSVMIAIPGNVTTGYEWVVKEAADTFNCELKDYLDPNTARNSVGAPGTFLFHVTPVKAGTQTVVIEYIRQFTEDKIPAGVCELTVEVSGDKNPAIVSVTLQQTE